MSELPRGPSGLDLILEELGMRYEYDSKGRLLTARGDGILPRFVLGRSIEGCLWRFHAALEPDLAKAVARLAGREKGFPSAGKRPIPPPERLVMIERLFAQFGVEAASRREVLTRNGVEMAELWILD